MIKSYDEDIDMGGVREILITITKIMLGTEDKVYYGKLSQLKNKWVEILFKLEDIEIKKVKFIKKNKEWLNHSWHASGNSIDKGFEKFCDDYYETHELEIKK